MVGFHKAGTGDPLACPSCYGAMRLVACITQASVIDQILTHRRSRTAREAHARSPTLRRSPEDGPDAPPPRGALRRGRLSHRRDGLAAASIAPPR